VTQNRSVVLSAGAFGLSAVALLLAALVALNLLAPPGHVGGPGTTSQIGSLRTEGNLHVDRNSSVSGSLNVTGPTSLNSLTTTADSRLSSVKLTGALNSESTLTGTQLISTVGNGHAPFAVNSSTLVDNLHASNSDELGGSNPGFYLNGSGGAQAKTGALSVGSLVTGALTAAGAATLGGELTAGGPTALDSSLSVAGPTALKGTLEVTGDTTVGGVLIAANGLGVTGNSTFNGGANVTGDSALNGNLTVSGTISGNVIGNLTGNATTAGTAADASKLGGKPGGFYLDTSDSSQAKVGVLQVGGIHSTTTLQVDTSAQVNGTLTVEGPTLLNRDVAGSSYFRGRAACVTAGARAHGLNCTYEGGVTLAAAPRAIVLTAAGNFSSGHNVNFYWVAPTDISKTGFKISFPGDPLVVDFYYVVVQ
jgi:cytoskeletal protein CcmA (bactofilin family)